MSLVSLPLKSPRPEKNKVPFVNANVNSQRGRPEEGVAANVIDLVIAEARIGHHHHGGGGRRRRRILQSDLRTTRAVVEQFEA